MSLDKNWIGECDSTWRIKGGLFSSLALKERQRDVDSKSKLTYSPIVKDKGVNLSQGIVTRSEMCREKDQK